MIDPAHLAATRAAYDTVAESYHATLRDHLADSPWDRAMLDVFASLVPSGLVGDLGCGPGRITGYLAGRGLDVFGVDLSPAMVEVARRECPGVRFSVGSMAALDLADGAFAGAVAWYSLIHVPPPELPVVVAELARVVRSGGLLLIAFQVGSERRHLTSAYGHEFGGVNVYRLDPDVVAQILAEAGLSVVARLVREGVGEFESTPQACLLARRI